MNPSRTVNNLKERLSVINRMHFTLAIFILIMSYFSYTISYLITPILLALLPLFWSAILLKIYFQPKITRPEKINKLKRRYQQLYWLQRRSKMLIDLFQVLYAVTIITLPISIILTIKSMTLATRHISMILPAIAFFLLFKKARRWALKTYRWILSPYLSTLQNANLKFMIKKELKDNETTDWITDKDNQERKNILIAANNILTTKASMIAQLKRRIAELKERNRPHQDLVAELTEEKMAYWEVHNTIVTLFGMETMYWHMRIYDRIGNWKKIVEPKTELFQGNVYDNRIIDIDVIMDETTSFVTEKLNNTYQNLQKKNRSQAEQRLLDIIIHRKPRPDHLNPVDYELNQAKESVKYANRICQEHGRQGPRWPNKENKQYAINWVKDLSEKNHIEFLAA